MSAPPSSSIAADTYSRTSNAGWGTADAGGSWTTTGSSTLYTVGAGTGRIRLNAGSGPRALLSQVASQDTDLTTSFSIDKPPTGSGVYLTVIGRYVPAAGSYAGKIKLTGDGKVSLALARFNPDGSGETTLQSQLTLPGLVYAPGAVLRARVQVIGASPTTVRAKVWAAGTPEPAAWQRSVTDNSVGWQAPGALGLNPYLSGTATNAQVTMSFDDLRADSP